MRRTVERRVLDEVCEAELTRVFDDGAGIHDEPKLRPLLRFGVLADVVVESVRERSDADFGVDRQGRSQRWHRIGSRGLGILRQRRRRQRHRQGKGDQSVGH
jgi:hypothetical protein